MDVGGQVRQIAAQWEKLMLEPLAFDVVVVGAGPAGLSAALVLGRCRRLVLICDTEEPRNAASHALHGFLTRDDVPPAEFRQLGRDQLELYVTAAQRTIEVADVHQRAGSFDVSLSDGTQVQTRKLLLATGVVDDLPQIDGFAEVYGRSAFHCPYCDGWEFRSQPLAIYGSGERGLGLALELTAWSDQLILCTDGSSELATHDLARLDCHGIQLRTDRIARLDSESGMLQHIVFENGDSLERAALFFNIGERQRSALPERLGCRFTERGAVDTGNYETTNVPGLYVAGDASRHVQLAIVAASEGAEAAFAINTALLKEDLHHHEVYCGFTAE